MVRSNNGAKVAQQILLKHPYFKFVFISNSVNSLAIMQLLQTFNPLGYLNKTEIDLPFLQNAFKTLISGGRVYTHNVHQLYALQQQWQYKLDPQDLKIIAHLLMGIPLPQIAKKVHLSLSGLEYRKRKIAEKLALPSNTLAAFKTYFEEQLGPLGFIIS